MTKNSTRAAYASAAGPLSKTNGHSAPRTFVWHDALGVRHEEPQDEYIARARERLASTSLAITDAEFRDVCDRVYRLALTPQIAALRPGDEVEITWNERAVHGRDGAPRMVERRCWARVVRVGDWIQGKWGAGYVGLRSPPHRTNGPIGVVGRTTLGREVTTHEAWISDVRPELDDAVRESWARRHA